VYIYSSSDFDPLIHEELKRMKRTVYRSLTDYFMFGNSMHRHLPDIVFQEILNSREGTTEQQVDKLARYLNAMIKIMQSDKSVIYVMCNQEDKFNWTDIAKAAG
jgi:phenylpyruvate tautomerase PptA (4-oxalocrotonate tautomerase family)